MKINENQRWNINGQFFFNDMKGTTLHEFSLISSFMRRCHVCNSCTKWIDSSHSAKRHHARSKTNTCIMLFFPLFTDMNYYMNRLIWRVNRKHARIHFLADLASWVSTWHAGSWKVLYEIRMWKILEFNDSLQMR